MAPHPTLRLLVNGALKTEDDGSILPVLTLRPAAQSDAYDHETGRWHRALALDQLLRSGWLAGDQDDAAPTSPHQHLWQATWTPNRSITIFHPPPLTTLYEGAGPDGGEDSELWWHAIQETERLTAILLTTPGDSLDDQDEVISEILSGQFMCIDMPLLRT
ncbi:hypothetical protein ACIGXM_14510 [Kitasatospora sp. NPDC052896]|uniref:hypothetical protein n=1 Tax=Kitasatospora sp. NPDC052896 TaxID=3364061 RepID=UPI0037CA79D9